MGGQPCTAYAVKALFSVLASGQNFCLSPQTWGAGQRRRDEAEHNAGVHRYGVWGDWEQPYTTLEPGYEAAQLRVFAKLVAAGHIYRRATFLVCVLDPHVHSGQLLML